MTCWNRPPGRLKLLRLPKEAPKSLPFSFFRNLRREFFVRLSKFVFLYTIIHQDGDDQDPRHEYIYLSVSFGIMKRFTGDRAGRVTESTLYVLQIQHNGLTPLVDHESNGLAGCHTLEKGGKEFSRPRLNE